ncbi:uncharacterized protein LOC116107531 [Pistacia vera]|uniref:uncharacterized protein LOC116107531 n=1 Tax=Pistacia vera TaxID=55513 RepID=UPI001262FBF9|nr:uncharacterized protein LOC116107531 [Pistacia vera]
MKKMKGVVGGASMEKSRGPSFSVYKDPRARFRHQSLMQDYEELLKETEAMKKKLQMMKQKKLTLSSEVEFLKRRHKFLIENQSPNSAAQRNAVQASNSKIQGKKMAKERNYSRKESALPRPPLGFDLNQKGKIYHEKEATLRNLVPGFDLNQKLKTYYRKELPLQNPTQVLDLNKKERFYNRKEAAMNSTPVFDLNQISQEEEELQFSGEQWRIEELRKGSARGGSDEQLNDMKLSACRNVGTGANRTGKRKISWQDQVALRV